MREPPGKGSHDSSTINPLIRTILVEHRHTPIVATQRLHALAAKAESEGRLADALELSTANLKLSSEINNGPAAILALLTHGRLLFKATQYDEAISCVTDAVRKSAIEKSLTSEHQAHIRYTASHILGASLWRLGRHEAASRALVETTNLARDRFGAGSPEVIKSLFDRAFLALESRQDEISLLQATQKIVSEARLSSKTLPDLANQALELGAALYHHCMWDAASYTLDWARKLTHSPIQKTEALLTLAHIAAYKSDTRALYHFLEQAEELWMDVAPRPHLERNIAHLRAIAALGNGCDTTYREQIALAQQREEHEELSIEERIQLHFIRAQAFRHDGREGEAAREVEDAYILMRRGIVTPLAQFNTFLQQGFSEYTRGNHRQSNKLIDEALIIAHTKLDQNTLLEARARCLRAHNSYSLFTYSEPSSPEARVNLAEALRDGERALEILTDGKLDPHSRKVLLRLLGGVANHLDLPWKQATYDRQLALLEAQNPQDPF